MPAMSAQYAMRRFLRSACAPRTKSRPSTGCANGEYSRRPGDRLEHQRHVLGRTGHGPGHRQRIPRPIRRIRRHEADRRPQSGDAAKCSRDPERSTKVGALCERNHAGRKRGGPSAGRAARRLGGVPRISSAAEDVVERVGAGRKFGTVGLAEYHRAGRAEAPDDECIFLRNVVGIDRRPEGRPQPGDRCHILDADGQSAEKPRVLPFLNSPVELGRIVQCSRVQRDDGVEGRVELGDAFETGLDRFDGGDLAGGDSAPQFKGGQVGETDRRLHRRAFSSAFKASSACFAIIFPTDSSRRPPTTAILPPICTSEL